MPGSILGTGDIDHLSLARREKYGNKLKENLPQPRSPTAGPMPLSMEDVQTPLEPDDGTDLAPLPDDFILSLGRLLGHPVKNNTSLFLLLNIFFK